MNVRDASDAPAFRYTGRRCRRVNFDKVGLIDPGRFAEQANGLALCKGATGFDMVRLK